MLRQTMVLFLTLLLTCPLSAPPAAAQQRLTPDGRMQGPGIKRVILITVDTLRYDVLSCYSPRGVQTPNIDSIAADSFVFRNAQSPSSWTLPAFASIMTGHTPLVHKTMQRGHRLSDSFETLAEKMQASRFRTAAFVISPFLTPGHNLDQGFQKYEGYPKKRGGKDMPSTTELTNKVIEWLSRNRNTDFFLWVHYFDPHYPYEPPSAYLPPGKAPKRIGNKFKQINPVRLGFLAPNGEERQWIEGLYRGEVKYVDDQIGRLLTEIKRLNLYDDSLLVFSSDHGEEFWDHESYGHGHALYQEIIHVPFMIKLPGQQSSHDRIQRVTTQSIMPTILDLTGASFTPARYTAPSLSPLLSEPAGRMQPATIISTGVLFYEDRIAVTRDNFKYIVSEVGKREQVFDLAQDPLERFPLLRDTRALERGRQMVRQARNESAKLRRRYHVSPGGEYQKNTPEKMKVEAAAPAPGGFHQPAVEEMEPAEFTDDEMDTEQLERLRSLGYIG